MAASSSRIRPKKRLGQNFLVDQGAVRRVVAASELNGSETVVEVGAGTGQLTVPLAERAKRVITYELDRDLARALSRAVGDRKNVEVRFEDILSVDLAELPRPYAVVANMPYYITSAIVRKFLESEHRPADMTLTIQADVAERITAEPPKMSVLAVSVQLFGAPRIAGRIGRTAFRPAPEVDSAILRIERIGERLEETLAGLPEAIFFRVVRAGFAEKRKQLHNALARNLALPAKTAARMLEEAGIDPARRAETLTVAEWVTLGRAYADR